MTATNAGRTVKSLIDVQAAKIDYSRGFVGNANLVFVHNPENAYGSASVQPDKRLRFFDTRWANTGVFDKRPVNVTSFVNQFRFQFGKDSQFGDGLAMVISNQSNTMGTQRGGESMGYGNDPNSPLPNQFAKSIAVVFDPWSTNPWPTNRAVSQTGLYVGGENPWGREIDLLKDGINLTSEATFDVRVSYDGLTLTSTITNARTGVTATQTYRVNIRAAIGGSSGYFGFVSSSERTEITRPVTVESWSIFQDRKPAVPTNPTATVTSKTISLRWNDVATTETGYIIERSTAADFLTGVVRDVVTANATSYQATGLGPNTTYYFRIRAVNAIGESASILVNAKTTAADSPGIFTASNDVGVPGILGGATFDSVTGTYNVRGGGSDIWGTADQFHFVNRSVTGNNTIEAKITGMTNGAWGEKAGVMFRQNLSANSPSVLLNYGAGIGIEMLFRTSSGAYTSSLLISGIPLPNPENPVWVRLVRTANTFVGYYSLAKGTPVASDWIRIGSVTVAMQSNVQAGLAVTAHNNRLLASGTFQNVSIAAQLGSGTSVVPAIT